MKQSIKLLLSRDDMTHQRGYWVITNALRDAGIEVVLGGIQTPSAIVETAIQEDVDAVSLSILSGAHNYLFPKVIELLKEQKADDIAVFGGGIVPEEDIPGLKEAGVVEIFTPGASTDSVIQWVRQNIKPRNL